MSDLAHMPSFDAEELALLRFDNESSMQDRCIIRRLQATQRDSHGKKQDVFVADQRATPCGFRSGTKERYPYGAQVPEADAQVRLPIATSITPNDQVIITQRFGQVVTPVTYTVLGEPMVSSAGLLLNLKRA